MNDDSRHQAEHQALREMLGAFALGHLDAGEADAVRAHLEGCASCAADLREIEPVVRRLDAADPALLGDLLDAAPAPPSDLGDRIAAAVASEQGHAPDELTARRGSRARPAYSRGLVAAAAVVALLLGGAVGAWLGRGTAPPPAAVVPLEPISLSAGGTDDITVENADLVAHTWGVELRFTGDGFTAGETFKASFRTEEGGLVPAGEFLGVGEAEMTCFLQSATMREDVTQVLVTDESGDTVLSSNL